MSDCHSNAPEGAVKLEKGHCVACRKEKSVSGTSEGAFCSPECESGWLRIIFDNISSEECLEIMARVMTTTEDREAAKARRWIRAFIAKA